MKKVFNTVLRFLSVLCSFQAGFCEPCHFGTIGILNLNILEARRVDTKQTSSTFFGKKIKKAAAQTFFNND